MYTLGMKNLSKRPNGIWQLRLVIPASKRHLLGKREFKKSLGRLSERDAQRKAAPILAEWYRQLESSTGASTTSNALSQRKDFERTVANDKTGIGQTVIDEYMEASIVCNLRSRGTDIKFLAIPDEFDSTHDKELNKLIDEGVHRGFICRPINHLKDYESLELLELKKRSKDQIISRLRNEFIAYFPTICDESLTTQSIQEWVDSYAHKPNPPSRSTLNKYFNTARSYCSWLKRKGYLTISNDPFTDVALPKRSKKSNLNSRKAFTNEELELLQKSIEGSKDKDLLDIFHIALFTGCRIEEIYQLKVKDIHKWNDRLYLTVTESKTDAGTDRDVPIHRNIEPTIRELCKDKSPNDYLFEEGSNTATGERSSKMGKKFGRLKTELGFGPDKVFHSLRRNFIFNLENQGVPEAFVSDIVGHKKQTMTYGTYGSGTALDVRFRVVDNVTYSQLQIYDPTDMQSS